MLREKGRPSEPLSQQQSVRQGDCLLHIGASTSGAGLNLGLPPQGQPGMAVQQGRSALTKDAWNFLLNYGTTKTAHVSWTNGRLKLICIWDSLCRGRFKLQRLVKVVHSQAQVSQGKVLGNPLDSGLSTEFRHSRWAKGSRKCSLGLYALPGHCSGSST